ncbi:MAG: response regulator transcription factor [Anaerolineales bacterium]|jgi:DNA-binding NarL/FixJ family response regulator
MTEISIFLAEGETHVRNAMRLMLDYQDGFVIIGSANTAESTLAQVCQNPPDAILLDWDFPRVNYQRLIHTLREHCPQTRLVATSVKPEHELAAHQVGTDVFISKQLPPDQFLAALRKFFGM